MDGGTPETGAPASGRRAVRHSRTRSEILDAAAELITEQGAEALNLSELATRAGFSNAASLYRYFSSKKELMGALMRRGLERLEDHLRDVPADLPPEEQLVEFCLAYVDYARSHPGERALLLTTTAVIAPEDRAASLPEEFVNRVFGLIATVIESGGEGESEGTRDWAALSTAMGERDSRPLGAGATGGQGAACGRRRSTPPRRPRRRRHLRHAARRVGARPRHGRVRQALHGPGARGAAQPAPCDLPGVRGGLQTRLVGAVGPERMMPDVNGAPARSDPVHDEAPG